MMQAVGVVICNTQLQLAQTSLASISTACESLPHRFLSLTDCFLLCLSLRQNSQRCKWLLCNHPADVNILSRVLKNYTSRHLRQQDSAVVSMSVSHVSPTWFLPGTHAA